MGVRVPGGARPRLIRDPNLSRRCDRVLGSVRAQTGVPGGLVGGPRAYQDQLRGFKSHRVHARRDFFFHKKVISGKRESVS